MRKAFVWMCVSLIVILGAGVASAQNVDFKGFYIGAHLGGVHGSANARTSTIFDPTGYFALSSPPAVNAAGNQELGSKGVNAGGTFGYNWQPNRWVFGGEVDFGELHTSSKVSTGPVIYPCCGTTFTISQKVRTSWMVTARPRVGYTWGKWLVYATGGLAIVQADYTGNFTDTDSAAHENAAFNDALFGWTAGAGFERQVHRHWNVKGEYLYAQFGDSSVKSTNLTTSVGPFPVNVFTHTTDFNTHIIRGGLNYRF